MTEQEWRWIFSKRLDSMLKEKGLRPAEFAKMVGTSGAAISRYLDCIRTPHIIILMKMCRVLGCTIDDLVCTEEEVRYE